MEKIQENIQRPRLVILYAYVITSVSILGFIGFTLLYFTDLGTYVYKANVSPILLAMSMFIFSGLGLITGSGLLTRRKYGWILAQFLLIYLVIRPVYDLIIMPFKLSYSAPVSFWDLLKNFLVLVICGFIIYYFNDKKIINYYGLQWEDAKRVYIISFLACIMVLFLSNFL